MRRPTVLSTMNICKHGGATWRLNGIEGSDLSVEIMCIKRSNWEARS